MDPSSRVPVVNPMHIISLRSRRPSLGVRLAARAKAISEQWFSHLLLLALISGYALLGAAAFYLLERGSPRGHAGALREALLEDLWIIRANKSFWMVEADKRLQEYEEAHSCGHQAHWTIWSSLFYCGTVLTTIGYGNITPSTNAGRAATIVYAFLGIPLMLMVLADLGKLFTKAIKFVFRYVRRFYKAGTFNKKKAAAISSGNKPLQYMTVSWRTVSQNSTPNPPDSQCNQVTTLTLHNDDLYKDMDFLSPEEVNHKHVEVEDDFNLPVSLAVALVLVYMVVGALLFTLWEEWTFFEAFYFVFISMSTVGFGDYVPRHQPYMMGAFVYLVLGLTLTSMCINVIQEKLSATFQKAKVRIGNTIGLDVNTLLGNESHRTPKSNDSELNKSNGCRSKISFHKDSVCGSTALEGQGHLGKEVLLNVPLQKRFTFYDSPYNTIQNEDYNVCR